MEIRPLGDSAAVIVYKNIGSEPMREVIQRDFNRIRQGGCHGITDVVLCFNSIGVYFDPVVITYNALHQALQGLLFVSDSLAESIPTEEPRLVHIPVNYGGAYGPDLEKAAAMLNLTQEEVVSQHTGTVYNVYGIGFLPGFPYMGDLPESLILPRKAIPEPAVKPGSVAIAGKQTGIYPFTSPGGWHVIGWTPLKMFDLEEKNPCFVKAGDRVRFTPL